MTETSAGSLRRNRQSSATRVAIAGLGGVGGAYLLTLVRLGVGRFNVADFDTFEIQNFNRQAGATTATIGRSKIDVMTEMALAINPELQINAFPDGVNADNVERFLEDAELYLDGLDFFVLDERQRVFAMCATFRRTWRPKGNGHPIQRLLIGAIKRRYASAAPPTSTE